MLATKIITNESIEKQQVLELYEEAFPITERMPFELMLELNSLNNVDLCSVYDDSDFVGFYMIIRSKNLVYISFLAVVDSKRRQGYGSAIIKAIKNDYPDSVIVVDEEPADPESPNCQLQKDRLRFYFSNGFKTTDYIVTAFKQDYEILSTSDDFNIDDYFNIFYSIGFTGFDPEARYIKK